MLSAFDYTVFVLESQKKMSILSVMIVDMLYIKSTISFVVVQMLMLILRLGKFLKNMFWLVVE